MERITGIQTVFSLSACLSKFGIFLSCCLQSLWLFTKYPSVRLKKLGNVNQVQGRKRTLKYPKVREVEIDSGGITTSLRAGVAPEVESSLDFIYERPESKIMKTCKNPGGRSCNATLTFVHSIHSLSEQTENPTKDQEKHHHWIQGAQRATLASVRCQKWHLPSGLLQPPRWWKSLHRGMLRPDQDDWPGLFSVFSSNFYSKNLQARKLMKN